MPPRHSDAVGFLLELRDSRARSWFGLVCDLAISSADGSLSDADLKTVSDLFKDSQLPAFNRPSPQPATTVAVQRTPRRLEQLQDFVGFKKLASSLEISFPKQINLVFGVNGSGKSSICEALKVLANRERPTKPIRNVRAQFPGPASFKYRFASDASLKDWNESIGFGVESAAIKYFDSAIALSHVTSALHPQRIVELSVFRLEVFEFARKMVNATQNHLQGIVGEESRSLQSALELLRADLGTFGAEPPFDIATPSAAAGLVQALEGIQALTAMEESDIDSLRQERSRLAAATDPQGIKALDAQSNLVSELIVQLDSFTRACGTPGRATQLLESREALAQKRAASAALNNEIFSDSAIAENVRALLVAASALRSFADPAADDSGCPLCHQPLSEEAVGLFRLYGRYLESKLRAEIDGLAATVRSEEEALHHVARFKLSDFAAISDALPAGLLDKARAIVGNVLQAASAPLSAERAAQYEQVEELGLIREQLVAAKQQLDDAAAAGRSDREGLASRVVTIDERLRQLNRRQVLHSHRAQIAELAVRVEALHTLRARIGKEDFSSLLRAMTNKAKEAHEAKLGYLSVQGTR